VTTLHADLRDGVLLQLLVEQLTGQTMARPSSSTFPVTLVQRMEIINITFSLLEKEGVKSVHYVNGKI
jgi:hypothetical protein